MITSNESLKTTLEKLEQKQVPKILVFGAPLNEIVHKLKTCQKKGRDETIKTVIDEQNKIINASANTEGRLGAIHLMVQPFMRQDPPWMEERVRWASFCVGDFIAARSPWNVGTGNPVGITPEDLGPDKVHLNASGMEKLYKILEKDLIKCKENLGEGDASQDWASQVADELLESRTPGTMKKRMREEKSPELTEEDEAEGLTIRKAKKNKSEDKMDKMFELLKEMKEDNKVARTEVSDLKDRVIVNDKKVDELRLEFDGMKEEVVRDGELTAAMLEDIDGLENENLRNTVIVRKLKAEKSVPKDKKALRTYVQDLARVLVCKVIANKEAGIGVKYASTLYSFIDPTKRDNKEGLVPPFKICFNSKDDAVYFRMRAVKLAKEGKPTRTFSEPDPDVAAGTQDMDQDLDLDEGASQGTQSSQRSSQTTPNICEGAYFSFYQTAATRFRATLMWAVADALKTKTKQVWVSQGNKPTLQIKEGGKVKSMTFVQTMTEYKEKIGTKTLDEVKKAASKLYAGNLEKTFVVIKD